MVSQPPDLYHSVVVKGSGHQASVAGSFESTYPAAGEMPTSVMLD